MKLRASGEDYLEAVLMLQKKNGMVRSIDLARHMEVSKPSVSRAVAILQEGGFLTVDSDYFLHLTEAGREVAEKIYERHQFFTEQLVAAGVDQETAKQEACRMEHAISDTSFQKLKRKGTGNRLAHIVSRLYRRLSAPDVERKKPLAEADNLSCSFYNFSIPCGDFEKSRPPFFWPILYRISAAARRRMPPCSFAPVFGNLTA